MSPERLATLKRLLRAIVLKAQLGSGLYDRHVTDADRVVNLVDILDEVSEDRTITKLKTLSVEQQQAITLSRWID